MGWVAYQLKRTNTETGAELGDITIIFPKLSKAIELPNSGANLTISDLVANPDFPIEAHVLCEAHGVSYLKEYGFGNVINLTEFAGETWTLNNGARMTILNSTPTESVPFSTFIYWYSPDGTGFGGASLDFDRKNWRSFTLAWMPCLLGENQEAGCTTGLYTYISGGYHQVINTINLPKIPQYDARELQFFAGATPIYQTDDPYGDGGETEPGGGTGTFDDTGDNVDIPSLPTLSAVDTSFITLYSPSLTELRNLASYMWSDLFDINTFKKLFADPMQAILGLSIVPVNVPVTATKAVKVGNMSTDVYMGVAGSQYIEVDCGTLDVKEFWGAYLDYDPYTKAEIYLPYIGTHPLAVDDIMGKPVHVVYHVDILSGACCAYVKCGGSVLYSFVGQCASSIPITGDNWTNVINGALSIAGSIGSMVATGGASAPMALGQIASTAVNSFKPSVEKSGAMGGTGGLMGVQTPYIILTRPRQALPKKQNEYTGYPSFITENLADLTGYTEVEHIHLENVPATEAELSEIETLLKSGVIF